MALRVDGIFSPRAFSVSSLCVPTDFTLTSNKPNVQFGRIEVEELIGNLLSRQFSPDAYVALTYFPCKKGAILGRKIEVIVDVFYQSLHGYHLDGLGDYDGNIQIAERMSIYNPVSASELKNAADAVEIKERFNQ